MLTGCVTDKSSRSDVPPCCRNAPGEIGNVDLGTPVCDSTSLWVTDSGKQIHLSDLKGRVQVVSMFYSTCHGICSVTRQDLQDIEASLSAAVRKQVGFVLVTFDGARDTSSALRAYRSDERLPPARWTLLRGDSRATTELATQLRIGFGVDGSGRFVHSSKIVVLDKSGRIIHRFNGLGADLAAITRAVEAAALN
jgi:protein SCO1/2